MDNKIEDNENVKISFSAMVMFLDDGEEETFDVELSKKFEDLTYDDVIDAIYNVVDERYGYTIEDFEDRDNEPYKVIDIVVNDVDGSWPVFPDDVDVEKLKKELDVEKFAVLPWARYGLTLECKLWMAMKEDGIVDEDEPFDYEKYHSLVEVVNEKK